MDGVSDYDYDAHISRYHLQEFSAHPPTQCPMEWSIFSAAQNLPAALNDPMRGKQSNMFTKKWGVEFNEKCTIPPSSYLLELRYDDFETYLQEIGKRYTRRNIIQQHIFEAANSRLEKRQLKQQVSENEKFSTPLQKYTTDTTDHLIETIPEIYLKEDLNLHQATTFRQIFASVFPQNERHRDQRPPLNENGGSDEVRYELKNREHLQRQLQEKLSHYLDIVEIRIAHQVSLKSSTFFHAMTSQDVIMKEMNSAMNIVRKMRQSLKDLQSTLVTNAIRALRLKCRHNNYKEVLDKLSLMITVHKAQPMLQLLLGTQDYVAALDLISTTQEILSQDLIGIQCFKHLPMQLLEMEKLIDKMLIAEFERYVADKLNKSWHKDKKSLHEDLEDNEISTNNCKLSCIVMGLLRIKNYTFVNKYKEECILAIRMIIKQFMIEFISKNELPTEFSLTGTGEEPQDITIGIWIAILTTVTVELLNLLRRIKSIANIIHDTINIAAGNHLSINSSSNTALDLMNMENFLNERDKNHLQRDLHELLVAVALYCHERCANFISQKSLEQIVASAEEIMRLSELIQHFDQGTQIICGVNCVPLKISLRIQISFFANTFHNKRKELMEKQLSSELWRPVDCPQSLQSVIDEMTANNGFKLIGSSNSVVDRHAIFDHTFLEKRILRENVTNTTENSQDTFLVVKKERFAIFQSVIVLIELIYGYCTCARLIPEVASFLSHNLIDLLRTFNSRCYQLVIGAGALRATGMKTITTINLALVARGLQLLLLLIPQVRNHFEHCESTTVTYTGYETIEKDFNGHVKEIYDKIVDIVHGIIVNHLNAWDVRPPIPSQSFRAISWHLKKLHEAVTNILPKQQILLIYDDIHIKFKMKLRERLQKLNVINDGRPQHGVVTSELMFYTETLRSIGVNPEGEKNLLETIWT